MCDVGCLNTKELADQFAVIYSMSRQATIFGRGVNKTSAYAIRICDAGILTFGALPLAHKAKQNHNYPSK
jgi:hypothetical protein